MFCQNCSAYDTDEAKFCSQCGESLAEVPRRKRFFPLGHTKSRLLSRGFYFVKVFVDLSFQQASSDKIRTLYRLAVLAALLFTILFGVMTFLAFQGVQPWILLPTLCLIFFSMVTCSRMILESASVLLGKADSVVLPVEKMSPKDQIEWNIE